MKQNRPPRKVSKLIYVKSVPQTDTGSQLETSKANEWEFSKELGKKAVVTSEYDLPLLKWKGRS